MSETSHDNFKQTKLCPLPEEWEVVRLGETGRSKILKHELEV